MSGRYWHPGDGEVVPSCSTAPVVTDEKPKFKEQALNLLVGELLGEGAYRRVYALRHAPDLVLKVDYDGRLTNAREWTTWCDLEHTEWAKWLAPCLSIDEFGGAMVQRRCAPLTDAQWEALDEHPAFLNDASKRSNWGWYQPDGEPGRPVMVDYAINNLATRGLARMKMVRR